MTEVNGSGSEKPQRKLTPFDHRRLQRALATGEKRRAQIAREFGVSAAYVTKFAKQYAFEIDQLKAAINDQFAGLWIADKENRILALQAEYGRALSSTKTRDHHEWIKARLQILHQAAEELGQLPPRTTVVVTPVVHIIENVDVELLK
jgi:hypothetical protein